MGRTFPTILTLICAIAQCYAAAGAEILVKNTSTWKWLHPTDGVDPAKKDEDFHSTFYKMDFDDSGWKSGKDKPGRHGGFGYGEEEFDGVSIDSPVRIEDRKTAYFRLMFTTEKEYENLIFKCQRDDGIIVYLDGKEVLRDNVGDGKEGYDLFAMEIIANDDETKVNRYLLKIKLAPGKHVLAISLHNRAQGSSDLRIAEISLSTANEVGAEGEDSAARDERSSDGGS